MVYIIEYDGESQYEKVFTKEQAEARVKELIEDGGSECGLTIFKAEEVGFTINNVTIDISVEE